MSVAAAVLTVWYFSASAGELRPGFTPTSPKENGKAAEKCEEAPGKAVISLKLVSKYGNDGSQRDTVDKEAEEKFNKAMQPVIEFEKFVVKKANKYTEKGDVNAAECVVSWLDEWANQDALSDMQEETAEYKRATTLSGLSLALLQVMPAIADDPRLPEIKKWMKNLALKTIDHYENRAKERSASNNHRYWAGLAVAGVRCRR